MRISVVIPTFNRIGTLGRALESVLAQTRPAHEIIVVDDGSTDGTGAWVARCYPEVRHVYQGHTGVSSARNRGIDVAVGEWIAFLDSDDMWLPEKLAVQAQRIAGDGRLAICHANEIWMRDGRRVNPCRRHTKYGGWIFQRCLPRCVISPSSVLIERRVLRRVGGFDEQLPACEDYDLWLRICARYPVGYVERPLIVKHGGHRDQLSRRHWGMDRFRIRALEKILAERVLSPADTRAALGVLIAKLRIVHDGAVKRNNTALQQDCGDKLLHYEAILRDLPRDGVCV